jgi:large subunit ribosomal protein L32e
MVRKLFIRKDIHKKKRLPEKWRKPKGITNKMRLSRKGHLVKVKPGYGKKKDQKGKQSTTGLIAILVKSADQLKGINPKTHAVTIAKLGKKKKLELIAAVEKSGIKITNMDPKKYKEKAATFFSERKEQSKERKEKQKTKSEAEKTESKKDKDKKTKKEEEPEMSQEEKQKQEKEERDKILTKAK